MKKDVEVAAVFLVVFVVFTLFGYLLATLCEGTCLPSKVIITTGIFSMLGAILGTIVITAAYKL